MAIALLQELENIGPSMQPYAIAYDINKSHSSAFAVLMHPSTAVLTGNGTIASQERAAQTADVSLDSPNPDNSHSDLHHRYHVVIQDRGS